MQNNAFKTLKSIATEHNKKLILTFALVLAENGLFLAYPIFAGFAINAIIQGNTLNALIYALFVLIAWLVGAIRRRVDTQVFANIYAKLAVNVIMNEKQNAKDDSAIIARVALSREFVNFFETHFPMFLHRSFRSSAQHLCSFCPAKGRCGVLCRDDLFSYIFTKIY